TTTAERKSSPGRLRQPAVRPQPRRRAQASFDKASLSLPPLLYRRHAAFIRRPALYRTVPLAGLERDFALLIRERPHPQFLLGDLPQPGQAGRIDDQKQHN